MKIIPKFFALIAVLMMASPLTIAPATAADVGLSINIGQPGYYGPITIADYPQPQVYYREPYWVDRRHANAQGPVYMRVPPGHRRNWSKHCGRYNACNQRVHFVQDRWYNDVYVPRYRERQGNGRYDRNDRRDGNHGNHNGRGNGNGNGKGKGRH